MDCAGRRRLLRAGLAISGLGLLAGCGVAPPGLGQPPRAPRIGYLSLIPTQLSPRIEVFRRALAEVGYQEGRNLVVEWRSADGREERLPELLAELLGLPVDVLVAPGNPVALAASRATSTVPIVTVIGGDPVALGLAASLARPGGNVTGLTDIAPQLAGKRLELLREAFPGIARVGVLWNAASPDKLEDFERTAAAARTLGLELRWFEVRAVDQLEAAFAAIRRERLDGLVTLQEALLIGQRARVAEFAAGERLPAIHSTPDFTRAGGLLAYGTSHDDLFRRAAGYVDKILKGTRAADLPMEQPTKFDLVVNLKAAQGQGLTIPESILRQATEIIR